MAIKIYPYKQGSRSARSLADALGGRVLRLQGSTYRQRQQDTIINWGSTEQRVSIFPNNVLNPFFRITQASNKLTAFNVMRDAGVQIPQFWTNREDIPDEAFPIVCRTILNGHSGRGIVIANQRDELVNAPLYVRYIKKLHEFRIHVGRGGTVICQQRKAIPNGTTPTNTLVRNHDNGYIYVREGFETPVQVIEQAQAAIAALGLDFGAVDVIWNQHYRQAYVLEVNTAPGLEGSTVTDYANYFRGLING
jgi:glutathione synthase/RimK-type ligase-like ATP-grasp enzyme